MRAVAAGRADDGAPCAMHAHMRRLSVARGAQVEAAVETSGTKPQPPWVPYYVMHKILAGLLSHYELWGSAPALAVAVCSSRRDCLVMTSRLLCDDVLIAM